MTFPSSPLAWACLSCVAISTAILVYYLWKAPPLDLRTKVLLGFGLGLFPALAGVTSTVAGMERTTHREFCGSCHVMGAHLEDAESPTSTSLAARHAKNPFFGEHNCYVCHADYSMIGYALTKLNGLGHVYYYYLGGYSSLTLNEGLAKIRLNKPFDNNNCKQCHSGQLLLWREVPEHVALESELHENQVSCASQGCHGYAHPFSKPFQTGGPVSLGQPEAVTP